MNKDIIHGFIIVISEQSVNEMDLGVIEGTILKMKEHGGFDDVINKYKDGLVKVDFERKLNNMSYQIRFVSKTPLYIEVKKGIFWRTEFESPCYSKYRPTELIQFFIGDKC